MSAYRSIVVGTDFSRRSRRGLDVAFKVAEALEARSLHVVHVLHSPTRAIPGFPLQPPLRAAAEAEAKLNALELPDCGAALTRVLRQGSPPRELCLAADEAHAQLLIVAGPHRRLAKLVLGSSTNTLVRIARCPVLVVNKPLPGDFDGRFRRVVAAVDLSPVSSLVLTQALNMARACGGQLCVRSVFEPSTLGTGDLFVGRRKREALDDSLARYEREVHALLRRAPRGGVDVEVQVIVGHSASDGLLSGLREGEADLLVIGSSGRNAWHRMVLGSTSQELLVNAPCPTLVVPATIPEPVAADALVPGAALDGS